MLQQFLLIFLSWLAVAVLFIGQITMLLVRVLEDFVLQYRQLVVEEQLNHH
jgi:hypothetical protein